MVIKSKIALSTYLLCAICMVILTGSAVFAQKIDTTKLSIKPKAKIVNRVPQIKSNIQPYKPSSISYNTASSSTASFVTPKLGKILTVLKIYPNPVTDQINLNLRLDRETTLLVKITDLLGNDVATLTNERTQAGEQTKTYQIPSKLNAGMYFIKIIAGGEQKVMRISVL
jgi:hypothetical protein